MRRSNKDMTNVVNEAIRLADTGNVKKAGEICSSNNVPIEIAVRVITKPDMRRKSPTMRLEEWSYNVKRDGSNNIIPDSGLKGKLFGHGEIPDGHPVITSAVERFYDNVVYTKDGTAYELGEMCLIDYSLEGA